MNYLPFICFITGYMASWLMHGRLIKRIKNTLDLIRKNNYGPIEAWLFSGKAI